MNRYFQMLCTLLLPVAVQAQEIKIDFESADSYQSVGVYDSWADSPFRTGKLKGNAAVVDNFLKEGNDSHKILGVQRSRFGSNTFGVRVDLKQPFEITPEFKYIHVKVNKPVEGRVMLMGLGKRMERAGQSREAEQFWVYSSQPVTAGEWNDAVFPVKGNSGIEIYSLVLVPDCSSPHALKQDFAAYVDDIEVSQNSQPRFEPKSKATAKKQVKKVWGDKVNLHAGSRNGYLTDVNGKELVELQIAYGKPYTIKANAAPGFKLDYVIIRHGNLNNEGTAQKGRDFKEERIEASQFKADGTFVIPAEWVDGDLSIDGQFASTNAGK